MDLQVVLVGAVVFVVSAVFIYLISAFTMKEKTFEEVMAEQKRRQEEEKEREKAKLEKKVEKDNTGTKKKYKKKEKPKPSPSSSPVPSQHESTEEAPKEHKMVNIELDPEIIEPIEPVKPVIPKPSKKKEKPIKPILHNKDEKTPITKEEVKEMPHTVHPKDDVELKHEREGKKAKKDKKQVAEAKTPVVEEMVVVETVTQVKAAPPLNTRADPGAGNTKLMSSLKSASLSEGELQAMIDLLLNKQGGRGAAAGASSDWNKKSQKGDPIALLRKQLEEKERSLQEEQQIAMAANTRLKELNQEKNKLLAMEKSYKEKIDFQAQEIQALHNRMHQTHEQHLVEMGQLRTRLQQLEGQASDQSVVKRLAEENNMLKETLAKAKTDTVPASEVSGLKQKVAIMETELSNNALKLNTSENTKKTLEQKISKLESDLKKLQNSKNSESVFEKRLDEVNKELSKAEAKNSSLQHEAQASKKALDTAHNEVVALKTKLQELEKALTGSDHSTRELEEKLKEAERNKIDMEGNLKNLQKKMQDTEKDKAELANEIKAVRQEKEVLASDLKVLQEQQQAKGQESQTGAPNGDVYAEDTSTKISVTEHEKLLSEKDSEISQLVTEVEKHKSDLQALRNDVETQKKKNNDLREKNWKAMDALEKSEKSVSDSVKSALKEVREQHAASQKEMEMFDQSVLQRIFPTVSVGDVSVHKNWMSKFEEEARKELSSLQKASGDSVENSAKFESQMSELNSRLSGMEQQLQEAAATNKTLQSSLDESDETCRKLTSQVAQYRSVLAETENKLTQLENSVEAEEKKWQERMQGSELELQQMRSEVAVLKEEVEKSRGSHDMKSQVEDLTSQLAASEAKCVQLQSQADEAERNLSSIRTQLEETKSSSANIVVIQNDLEDLRKQLEAEKKKNKELASNVVKLNGIIKTGHDALTQEQQLVEKLRKELETHSPNSVPTEAKTETDK